MGGSGRIGGRLGPAGRAASLGLGWLCGVALQLQLRDLPPPNALLLATASALLLGLAAWFWRRAGAAAVGLFLAAATLAFTSTCWRAQVQLQDRLPAALEGVDVQVTGLVASLPRHAPQGSRFVFEPESATFQGAPVRLPQRLSLGWYRGVDEDSLLAGPAEPVRAGQRWQFTVRLRQPHGSQNPHGFDLELWMFERGLGASGHVRARPATPPLKLAEAGGLPIERARQALRDALQQQVGEGAAAGVLAALLIGDQAAIEREDWEVFRSTGVAHLMSISGLHVTMFAWLAGGVVGWLWRRHPTLPLRLPAPQAARWGGLLCALAYALLAGWGVPAQRTVGMIAVVVLLRSSGWRWPLQAVLLAAALAVTLADPWAMLQPGFWLSFVAVALLVASEPAQAGREDEPAHPGWAQRAWRAVKGGLRTQAVATAGLAPLTLVFFQQLSLVGFVANLVAIPLVTLAVVPLAMLGVLLPPLWSLAAALVQGLMVVLEAMARVPWAVWQAAAAPPWAMACGLLAGALAVLPLPPRWRWLAVPLLLPLLVPPVARPGPGQFELVAADVGQGTAVLVRTQHHLLVYDSGPAYSPVADAGSRVLLPLLRARGERRIHLLMLSHRDTDHVGGAAALLAGLPVQALSSSLEPDHALLADAGARGTPHTPCKAGQRWQWDGVQFELLHPQAHELLQPGKPNAVSCVLRVSGAARAPGSADPASPAGPSGPAFSVLLTGDIEAAQEAALVQRSAAALPSTVLLVPHHGSKTSSTPGFIAAVQPQVAVVQAAHRSRYGHPAPEVVARYETRGISVVRSNHCGAFTLAPDGGTQCERQVSRRYWHHEVSARHPAAPARLAGRP
jgi:competence protein ComEC